MPLGVPLVDVAVGQWEVALAEVVGVDDLLLTRKITSQEGFLAIKVTEIKRQFIN